MTFAAQLQAAKSHLTAREVASAVSPLLSVRTVEDWLADRRSPPAWAHDWIISRVRGDLCLAKKARSRKGQNASHQAPAALDAATLPDASSRLPACDCSPTIYPRHPTP